MSRHWNEKLHPRRSDGEFVGKGGGDWISRLSGVIDGAAPAAPKIRAGYVHKRPKDIKPGSVISDVHGKDRIVGSVVFHKVNVHSPNRTTAPSGRALSSYEFRDVAGHTIVTRHGPDAQGTSWIDVRDWAAKAGDQVKPIERSAIRPHEVKVGDRLLGLGGTYKTVARVANLDGHYRFYDDRGNVIAAHHTLRQGDPTAGVISRFGNNTWVMVERGPGPKVGMDTTLGEMKRPRDVNPGDMIQDQNGAYQKIDRVRLGSNGWTFYDSKGLPIVTRHGLSTPGDETVSVKPTGRPDSELVQKLRYTGIGEFSDLADLKAIVADPYAPDSLKRQARVEIARRSEMENRAKRVEVKASTADVTDDTTFRRVRDMLGENPTAVQLRAGAKDHDAGAKYYAKERQIFLNGSGRVSEADRKRILAKFDASIAAHEAAAASLRARADALKKKPATVRAKKPAVTGPPPSPTVHPIGRPRDLIDDRVAQERMRKWREDAQKPGTQVLSETVRQREIRKLEAEVTKLEVAVKGGASAAKAVIKRKNYSSAAGYQDAVDRYTRYYANQLDTSRHLLSALQRGRPIPGYDNLDKTTADALHLDPAHDKRTRTLAQEFDPARPLAIYGSMLHLEDMRHANGDTWHSYQAMDALEQKIPPIFHLHAAQHIAGSSDPNAAGIYIGRVGVPEMDSLQDLREKQPRGWHKGSTWKEVDGVHRDSTRTLAIGYTSNTEAHRSERMAHYAGRTSNPSLVDGTAALHEFGHLLDDTYGTMNPTTGEIERASKQRLFRLVHSKVVKYAGRRLNPYFKQKGDAGPQEFFAESFGEWARAGEGAWTFASSGEEVPGPGGKPLTKRTQHLANQFYLSNEIAAELDAYYTRLLNEATSGKRKTTRQLREGIR